MKDRKVLLLGYGREGQSSYNLLQDLLAPGQLGIVDRDPFSVTHNNPIKAEINAGVSYLDNISSYDLILRSPGIPRSVLHGIDPSSTVTSQSALFLEYFHHQVIGITGTKGKSTTSTLLHAMLESSGQRAHLAGNIGLPPFEVAGMMKQGDVAVLELSAHQLEEVERGPHIGCLLNLFEEHLDHFLDPMTYYSAKWRIFMSMDEQDIGLYPIDSSLIHDIKDQQQPVASMLAFSQAPRLESQMWLEDQTLCIQLQGKTVRIPIKHRPGLPGMHNLCNILVAASAALLAGGNTTGILMAVERFQGLPHRMQYVGNFNGIDFYNDAIATVPEATIAAIKTLGRVNTLLLGGMDRGIRYDQLIEFIIKRGLGIVCLSGPAGKRIHNLLLEMGYQGQIKVSDHFEDALALAVSNTPEGGCVLLSPSAPSYDEFRDYTEKGTYFMAYVKGEQEA